MKKSLARGAAAAFLSAAIVLPLAGVAQAMTPTWNHPEHQKHCRHHHHHHHHHHHLWNDGWQGNWAWGGHRGFLGHF
ncbi:hypothetical protein [Streptantibioticus ferralitis]|uniref:Uncharacterized protein n=1 Tax=Streptantibioticus ferralitis TaxID=236510 RepID=A0ABT5YX92_9ACTN|nr:hypothetical protein [Streptantibioticus ferralitis]MDF2256180.1 hypothetical protein [Streptantibioticus ferralitis]